MKKFAFLVFGAFSAVFASATPVESSNVFGILKVSSPYAETILCVPWVGVGSGSTSLTANDVVLTSNLKKGDTLSAMVNGSYETWVLETDGGSWTTTTSYTYDEESGNDNYHPVTQPSSTTSPESVELAKGGAFILCRNGDRSYSSEPIYISGQHSSNNGEATIVGNTQKAVYNFFAPPYATSVQLNDLNFYSIPSGEAEKATVEPDEGDVIMVNFDVQFKYDATAKKWGKETKTKQTVKINGKEKEIVVVTLDTNNDTIDAGIGAWYIRNKGKDSIKVEW